MSAPFPQRSPSLARPATAASRPPPPTTTGRSPRYREETGGSFADGGGLSPFVQSGLEILVAAGVAARCWRTPGPTAAIPGDGDPREPGTALGALWLLLDTAQRWRHGRALPDALMADLPAPCPQDRIGGQIVECVPLEDALRVRGVHPSIPFYGGARPMYDVEAEGNFGTAVAGVALRHGRWYYECSVDRCSLIQVGWVTRDFTCDSDAGLGVGDDPHSWACARPPALVAAMTC